MVVHGPPSSYTIGGAWPNPPDDRGWRRASIDTDHGRLLIGYLESGVVDIADPPTKIWKTHSQLRVVNPKTKAFARFVKLCKQAFTESISSRPTSATSTTEASTINMPTNAFDCDDDYDDSSRGNQYRPPDPSNRMPLPQDSNTMDPLMHRVDYATRDQQVSLPTRVYEGMHPVFSPLSPSALLFNLLTTALTIVSIATHPIVQQGFLIEVNLLANLGPEKITITRDPSNKKNVKLEWDGPFKDEIQVEDIFCSGCFEAVGYKRVRVLNAAPGDNAIKVFQEQTICFNGTEHDVDNSQVAPKIRHIIPLPAEVKPVPSQWQYTDRKGKTRVMESTISLRERVVEYGNGFQLTFLSNQGPLPPGGRNTSKDTGIMFIFFKREDADSNTKHRFLSPTRGPYRPTPTGNPHYAQPPPPPPPHQAPPPPYQAPPAHAPYQQEAHVQPPPAWDQAAQDRFEAEVRARVQQEMMRGGNNSHCEMRPTTKVIFPLE